MDIKPIRSEADYETALKTIEQFWDAAHGSPAVLCYSKVQKYVDS